MYEKLYQDLVKYVQGTLNAPEHYKVLLESLLRYRHFVEEQFHYKLATVEYDTHKILALVYYDLNIVDSIDDIRNPVYRTFYELVKVAEVARTQFIMNLKVSRRTIV